MLGAVATSPPWTRHRHTQTLLVLTKPTGLMLKPISRPFELNYTGMGKMHLAVTYIRVYTDIHDSLQPLYDNIPYIKGT